MFWPDVIALKEFYASSLGQITYHMIRRQIQKIWPGDARGDSIVGLGFATPYLTSFLENAQSTFACMPAMQGVMHWPANTRNLSLLSDEAELPFADNSINRVIVAHALENSEQMRQMLSEIWRILSPAGRLLVIAPNRRGIWARSPKSPFAYGQPFTAWQLRQLLAEHSFTSLNSSSALFFPPTSRRTILRSARFCETIGRQFFPGFGGVLLMEAEKQIYAPAAKKMHVRYGRAYASAVQSAPI
jgi:SAM-dependent methyltransferase